MARLNDTVEGDSDDELPELAQILRGDAGEFQERQSQGAVKTSQILYQDKTPMSKTTADYSVESILGKVDGSFSTEEQCQKQRCYRNLKPTQIEPTLLSPPKASTVFVEQSFQYRERDRPARQLRSSLKRTAAKPVNYSIFSTRHVDGYFSASEDDEFSTDLSGFIVPDSISEASEEDEKVRKPRQKGRIKSSRKVAHADHTSQQDRTEHTLQKERTGDPPHIIDPSLQRETAIDDNLSVSPLLEVSPSKDHPITAVSFDLDDPLSRLRFSPPRSKKPSRTTNSERPVTPPASPSKVRSDSPSKRVRIPPSPHRPSIDAFWSQDVINDWNDSYSPKKAAQTPSRKKLLPLDEEDHEGHVSPSASPRKSPLKSPTKKDRQAAKAFNAEKSRLASTFLAEVDDKVTGSQVSNLAASTGGIKIIWSKKLSSTAGRANWRREAIRHKSVDGTYTEPKFRHHASIELAEKVIDSEDRLINVLAHEFCHLANFMISGVKDQPHGKEFKRWAANVTAAFGHRGVEVTTKHGYDISYKYIWSCGDCGLEYKRHSKSIDLSKHSCGACKGKLLQILPVPRKESEYQRFVKANWERVKKGAGEGAGMGEINVLLAKEWEVMKDGEKKAKMEVQVTEVAEVADDGGVGRDESPELDKVARKLDFLTLAS